MSKKMRWGILGTGMIARKFACQLPESETGVLAAVGSRSISSASSFTTDFGGEPCGSYGEVLEDPEVDAVYIPLPNGMHKEWSIRAMEAGKHVLCEKPLGANLAEVEEMFAVAGRTGRTLVEGFMYLTHPAVRRAIEAARSGAIGELRVVRSSFTFCRGVSREDARYDPAQAGGGLMDVGCYPVSLMRALAGWEPTEVRAWAHIHETGVDDYAVGMLRFGDTLLGTFTCGMTVFSDRGTYLGGSEGEMYLPDPWACPDGRYQVRRGEGEEETVTLAADKPAYAREADAFADAVAGGGAWFSEDDSKGNMRVLDELRRQVGVPV